MAMRTSSPTCNDRIERKRTAPETPLDERVYKYLKSAGNTDCLSIDPLYAASEQGDTSLNFTEPLQRC